MAKVGGVRVESWMQVEEVHVVGNGLSVDCRAVWEVCLGQRSDVHLALSEVVAPNDFSTFASLRGEVCTIDRSKGSNMAFQSQRWSRPSVGFIATHHYPDA